MIRWIGLRFNEAEALKPRIRARWRSAASRFRGSFNEAEALKPRIQLSQGEAVYSDGLLQ